MGSTRDFVNYVYPGIKGIKGKFKKKSKKKNQKKKITLLRRRKHAYYDLMSLKKKKVKVNTVITSLGPHDRSWKVSQAVT